MVFSLWWKRDKIFFSETKKVGSVTEVYLHIRICLGDGSTDFQITPSNCNTHGYIGFSVNQSSDETLEANVSSSAPIWRVECSLNSMAFRSTPTATQANPKCYWESSKACDWLAFVALVKLVSCRNLIILMCFDSQACEQIAFYNVTDQTILNVSLSSSIKEEMTVWKVILLNCFIS